MAYGKNIYLISEDAVRTQRFSHLANKGTTPPVPNLTLII